MSKHILIVDDDDEDVELFCDAIKEIGLDYECDSVGNGHDALLWLIKVGQKLPDYIFLDMNMPKMSGKQCLGELKKMALIKHIKVIMYSTSKLKTDIAESLQLGAAHFLTKPNSFNVLKKELALLLK